MDPEDVSPPGWLRSHPTLAVVGFAALVALALILCQFTGFVARPRPPASPTQTPSVTAVAPTGSRTPAAPALGMTPAAVEVLKTPAHGAPVAFVAWGSYRTFATYVAPTRPPGDPRFPAGSRYPLGINVLAYMSSAEGGVDPVWDVTPVGCSDEWCSKSNINWTPLDRAIATVSAYTVTLGSGAVIPAPVTLNLPPMMLDREPDTSCGSEDDPCIRAYVPAWMEPFRKTFQNVVGGSNWWYNTVNYGDPVFRARIKQFLTEAAARYDMDARVTAIRVDTGFQGETQPVKKDKLDAGTEDDLIASHEKIIPCAVYQSYVREIAEHAYAVFKHKPVYLMPGPAPCAGQSGQRWRYDLLYAPEIGWEVVTPKKMIGFSLNNDNPDLSIAGEQPGNPYADYRWWAMGPKMYSLDRPVIYETGANPTDALVDGDPWAFMVWRAYAVAGAKGDFFMSYSSWWRYATPLFWDVVDNWMARRPQRLWIVFRNSEWTTYNWTEERGASGYLGVWGNWLDLQGRDGFKQACNQTLYQNARSEVITLKATPSLDIFREPCDQVLPAPAITPMPTAQDGLDMLNRTSNRQALVLDATGPSSEMHVALATDHPAYGLQSPLTVTVSYLDRGADRFFLTFPAADGTPVRLTVVKSGTNIWQQQTFRVKAARLENRLSSADGPVFLIISNDSNSQPEYLHEVYADIDWPSLEAILNGERLSPLPSPLAVATCTATVSVTPSQTPSVTPRPSATATPTATATATASATASPTGTASPTATAMPLPPLPPTFMPLPVVTRTATPTVTPSPTATRTTTLTTTASPTVTHTVTATITPSPTATHTSTTTPSATASFTPTATLVPTPSLIRAKIEIVWPHGGASVQDADLANLAVYLIEPGGGNGGLLQPPACGWTPVVRLWVALNAQPARPVAVGQKRMVTESGRTFPVWDFNDVDVSAARDPSNKLSFFATVDGVRTLHNVWVHAADARTIFPQPDMPTGVISRLPTAVDARIEIVWPHDSLPTDQANLANVTAYLFSANGTQAISSDVSWRPTARLHWALNNDTEAPPDVGLLGIPRTVTGANGVKFLAYDFNDVDVSAARDPLNRIYFWVSTDELVTFPNVWAHATDARTIFAQPDTLNSCR